ncbi:MAG: arginine--tRNA ligase [Flavobacteriales bacterium]|nr:arginine--tRNA ligase [Flavobacteriales bacterium]
MDITQKIAIATADILKMSYDHAVETHDVQIDATRKEFEGDYTVVIFPYLRALKMKPEEAGDALGDQLLAAVPEIESFNVIKGFLNLSLSAAYWSEALASISSDGQWLTRGKSGGLSLVEYSSPNTNKPLHLGHLRNNFLGHSVSLIKEFTGNEVIKTQIINDRGVHICKSMLAWKELGNGETPDTSGLKGDKLVGKYYVKFDQAFKKEQEKIELNRLQLSDSNWSDSENLFISGSAASADTISSDEWHIGSMDLQNTLKQVYDGDESALDGLTLKGKPLTTGFKDSLLSYAEFIKDSETETYEQEASRREAIKNNSPLYQRVRKMLIKWEQGDPETIALWKMMNSWVYEGFDETYARMGVSFDKLYHESETYLKGKDIVKVGLEKGIFFTKDDGSVWVNLEADGLDQKLLLRADGTTVYMTQDIGTAAQRQEDYPSLQQIIYTVGDEQDYHFKVLFLILEKLGYDWAPACRHLSYGMVDLPSGKMKSREGTVVDADDLMAEVVDAAKISSEEKGKLDEMEQEEQEQLFEMLGIGALKFYLLRVDPRKRMMFDPEESVSLNGDTGPFVQYTHARCKAVLRKAGEFQPGAPERLSEKERQLLRALMQFRTVMNGAAEDMNPSAVASYCIDLAKMYNQFYHDLPILKAEDEEVKGFRLALTKLTAETIATSMGLLGIRVPERM